MGFAALAGGVRLGLGREDIAQKQKKFPFKVRFMAGANLTGPQILFTRSEKRRHGARMQ